MAENSAISWTDATFNPWIGCTKVSPACDGCYAEALMDKRYGRVQWGAPGQGAGTRARTSGGNWKKPLAWNRKAEKDGTRPFVFCASLADVFDNQVPDGWRRDLFDLIRATPQLVWLLLTKRPQNIVKMAERCGGLPANAAIGATCEDQERADKNVPALLDAKAHLSPAFTFLSCEPLLGAVSFRWAKWHDYQSQMDDRRLSGVRVLASEYDGMAGIDWIITGGETDQGSHKARPTNPDWFRSIRDQCAAAGVAYHHKQNGEFLDGVRVGKHRSGRMIDGVTHDAVPAVRSMPMREAA